MKETEVKVMTRSMVIEAAREFGEVLADCDECRALEKAEEALRKDKEARELISEYQSIQYSIQMARMWGRKVEKGKIDELKRLEAKINSNQIIKNLLDAQKRLQEMLRNINTEISDLLGIDFAANSGSGGCC